MSTLEKAIEIAASAHQGQKQKDGMPYIIHPLTVMMKVETLEEKIVAVLHDVIEDTEVTLADLQEAGFADEVLAGVELMTRTEGQDYEEYIEAISRNAIARKVKLADMRNNIDLLRIPVVKDKDLERCRKYHRSIRYLEEID